MPMLKRKLSEAVSTSLKAKASSFNPSVTLYEVKPEPVPDGENIAGGSSEQAESAVKAEGVTEAVRTRSLRRSTRVKRQDVKDPSGSNSVGSGDGDGPGDEHQTRGRKRVKREELVPLIKMEQEDELVLKMEQIDEAFSSTTRATTRRNSVKATAASPKKRKRIPQALDVPHPAPENWKEVYDLIKDMRSKITAPVDTMGCDQAQRHETDPKNRRFSTLVSLMLSSQTKDEVTDAAVSALREAVGGTLSIDAIIAADESTISQAIGKVGFWRRKTQYLKQAAEKLRDNFDSDVPKTVDELCSLPGVGPKMAFLALQVAWDLNVGIGVDVHVHRITNRLGWHNRPTKSPEETRLNLQSWLPTEYHREINHMLVGFGQVVCLPVGPRCDSCELSSKGLCPSAQSSGSKSKARAPARASTKAPSPSPKVEIQLEE